MSEGNAESTFITNRFGTVTDRRVIYFRSKGWFSGGSREDIPLQHVTSVRLEMSRKWLVGIVLVVVGLLILGGQGDLPVFGVIVLAFAVLLLLGSPKVVVNTAGGDVNASTGFPWQRGEANAFVEALRGRLSTDKPSQGPADAQHK